MGSSSSDLSSNSSSGWSSDSSPSSSSAVTSSSSAVTSWTSESSGAEDAAAAAAGPSCRSSVRLAQKREGPPHSPTPGTSGGTGQGRRGGGKKKTNKRQRTAAALVHDTDDDEEEENGGSGGAVGGTRPRRRVGRRPGRSAHFGSPSAEVEVNNDELVLLKIPPEVIIKIFALLDIKSLIRVGQVCRQWRALSKDDHLWRNRDLHLVQVWRFKSSVNCIFFGFVCCNHVDPEPEVSPTDRNSWDEGWKQVEKRYISPFSIIRRKKKKWYLTREGFSSDPALRSFFSVLMAAPCLRQLRFSLVDSVIRCGNGIYEALVDQVLASDCRVHSLTLKCDHYDGEFVRLLEGLRGGLEELRLSKLTTLHMPALARMTNLKVLQIVDTVHQSAKKGATPVFARQPQPQSGTLVEFRATGRQVLPRTVYSALEAHAGTLCAAQFYCALTNNLIKAMAKCTHLRELHLRCQPHMDRLTAAAPNLQRLTLLLDSFKDDPDRLRSLPTSVRDLVLYAPRRLSLQSDLRGLVQGCKALPQLRSITIHCKDWRKQIHTDAHRVFLLEHFPTIEVVFVRFGYP